MDENYDLFQGSQVSNELEAYLIGFFYADGCVTEFKYGAYRLFTISLAEKDKEYLQWMTDTINQHLHTNYKLRYLDKTKSYRLSVCKKDFIANLIRLGISPNKTYEDSDYIFQNIPNDLKWHFIRGYFDGDGSIHCNKDGKHGVNIVSLNQTLIDSICNYCYECLHCGVIRKDRKYYRFYLSGNPSVLHFGEHLYQNAHYFMSRKKDKFDNINLYYKNNIYVGILPYLSKYKVSIWNKVTKKRIYLGLRATVKEAVELYNNNCELCAQLQQEYKGEELYYEQYFFVSKMDEERKCVFQ